MSFVNVIVIWQVLVVSTITNPILVFLRYHVPTWHMVLLNSDVRCHESGQRRSACCIGMHRRSRRLLRRSLACIWQNNSKCRIRAGARITSATSVHSCVLRHGFWRASSIMPTSSTCSLPIDDLLRSIEVQRGTCLVLPSCCSMNDMPTRKRVFVFDMVLPEMLDISERLVEYV